MVDKAREELVNNHRNACHRQSAADAYCWKTKRALEVYDGAEKDKDKEGAEREKGK